MLFAAIINYQKNPELIQATRPSHRAYLTELQNNGKLFASGPFADDSGALIIYEAESAEEAAGLLENDPFRKAGVFASWEVRPWRRVF